MNYFDLYSSYPDSTIAAAWNSQVKEADKNPWLSEALKQYGDELFARFTACYADLRALPRGARRSLQRRIARSREIGSDLARILSAGRATITASDGLVACRCRFTVGIRARGRRQRLRSQLRRAIRTSQPMASVRS